MSVAVIILLALFADRLFAEPKRYHPLIGFGVIASWLELLLNRRPREDRGSGRIFLGAIAWSVAVLPLTLAAYWLQSLIAGNIWLYTPIAAAILYVAIGWQSLLQHAAAISAPLKRGDLATARRAVAMIVSRDPEQLDQTGVARAATESVLENGADAIFSAIFWFCVAGIPGVVLYRLSNTLDAMWGYRNARFLQFGRVAARVDDLLNFIPARLTALSYALCGDSAAAMRCWWQQGYSWKSPNAGPVMAAGAGALRVSLGGVAQYHRKVQQRPLLGLVASMENLPVAQSIDKACRLLNRSLLLWLLAIVAVETIVLAAR